VYPTTYSPSQWGASASHAIAPGLHFALSPSAQRENRAQHPSPPHRQSCASTKTEWQSVRASHSSTVAWPAQLSGGQT
jgi:hypothetical protein